MNGYPNLVLLDQQQTLTVKHQGALVQLSLQCNDQRTRRIVMTTAQMQRVVEWWNNLRILGEPQSLMMP